MQHRLSFRRAVRNVRRSVRAALLEDLDPLSAECKTLCDTVRRKLAQLGGASAPSSFTTVLVPGDAEFAVEALLGSVVPEFGKLLVVRQGEWGAQLAQVAAVLKIAVQELDARELPAAKVAAAVDRALGADPSITHVAAVHREPVDGRTARVEELGRVTRKHGNRLLLDARASYGLLPLDLEIAAVDFVVGGTEILGGVPGLGFVVAREDALRSTDASPRSATLDLRRRAAEADEFGRAAAAVPPGPLLALAEALALLEREGGVQARRARAEALTARLRAGLSNSGLEAQAPQAEATFVSHYRVPPKSALGAEELVDQLGRLGVAVDRIADADGTSADSATLAFTTLPPTEEDDVDLAVALVTHLVPRARSSSRAG